MHEWREVAVPRADDKRGDVVTFESHLERINRHLDVRCVLASRSHPLGDLDELNVVAGETLAVVAEERPIRIRLPGDYPAAIGERVGNGFQVELESVEVVPRSDRQVLVVQEKCNPFFFRSHARQRSRRMPFRPLRDQPHAKTRLVP